MSLLVFYALLSLSSQLELINQLDISTDIMPLGTNDCICVALGCWQVFIINLTVVASDHPRSLWVFLCVQDQAREGTGLLKWTAWRIFRGFPPV